LTPVKGVNHRGVRPDQNINPCSKWRFVEESVADHISKYFMHILIAYTKRLDQLKSNFVKTFLCERESRMSTFIYLNST